MPKKTTQKSTDAPTPSTPENTSGAHGGLPLAVNGQYIKDLSFEHPSPFRSGSQEGPTINLDIDVHATPLEGQQFEVDLHIVAEATRGSERAFILELTYSGAFSLAGVPQDYVAPILLVECPRLLFPFARNIIATVTRESGFPPLVLAPVDFAAIYRQQAAHAEQQEASNKTPS